MRKCLLLLFYQIRKISLTENLKGSSTKFELATDGRQDVYTLQPIDPRIRTEWVLKIKQLVFDNLYGPDGKINLHKSCCC